MIVFTLTMPGRNTWNGKWSGDDYVYARAKCNRLVPESLYDKDFYYSWDDGWTACVSVKKMDSKEARKIMRKSRGFCGYDWMIESLLIHGEIKAGKGW